MPQYHVDCEAQLCLRSTSRLHKHDFVCIFTWTRMLFPAGQSSFAEDGSDSTNEHLPATGDRPDAESHNSRANNAQRPEARH